MLHEVEQAIEDTQKVAERLLVGRTIQSVEYMSETEAKVMGWSRRCLLLTLDNGKVLNAVADDEGNQAGALWLIDEGPMTEHDGEDSYIFPAI